eukprot:6197969-Pleurochrysis_carterae.AAC.1
MPRASAQHGRRARGAFHLVEDRNSRKLLAASRGRGDEFLGRRVGTAMLDVSTRGGRAERWAELARKFCGSCLMRRGDARRDDDLSVASCSAFVPDESLVRRCFEACGLRGLAPGAGAFFGMEVSSSHLARTPPCTLLCFGVPLEGALCAKGKFATRAPLALRVQPVVARFSSNCGRHPKQAKGQT